MREYQETHDLRALELARLAKLPAPAINRYLSGAVCPSISSAAAIEKATQIPIASWIESVRSSAKP